MPGLLDSEQAARRLGVKLPTLYAYVSRGLVASRPSADRRRSLFDADDIEALARRSRGGRTTESKVATVMTGITQLGPDGPLYRGRRATDLASSHPYEEVAELLWGTGAGSPSVGSPSAGSTGADSPGSAGSMPWSPAQLRPPAGLSSADRIRWAVVMLGARDPRRGDLRPATVTAVARTMVATFAAVLSIGSGRSNAALTAGAAPPPLPRLVIGRRRFEGSVAATLATSLMASQHPHQQQHQQQHQHQHQHARPPHVRALNAAMVLLADHELAASTLAVRVAASTRADPYDAVLAGLGAMAGPLHSGAPLRATAMLHEARRVGAQRAVDDALTWQGSLPGFGHAVYDTAGGGGGDPRFGALYGLVEKTAPASWRAVVEEVVEVAHARGVPAPNVDLGLAGLTLGFGMPDEAGTLLFTIARVAGWIAHYLEELGERPLRFRTRAIYAIRP